MSRWIDRLKFKLDRIADDVSLLTPLEGSLLVAAVALAERLEGIEMLGDSDARLVYFREACQLRRMFRRREPYAAGEVINGPPTWFERQAA
jgi:hypothetical protein